MSINSSNRAQIKVIPVNKLFSKRKTHHKTPYLQDHSTSTQRITHTSCKITNNLYLRNSKTTFNNCSNSNNWKFNTKVQAISNDPYLWNFSRNLRIMSGNKQTRHLQGSSNKFWIILNNSIINSKYMIRLGSLCSLIFSKTIMSNLLAMGNQTLFSIILNRYFSNLQIQVSRLGAMQCSGSI